MADITFRLIYYRLGESYHNMAEAASSMYANLTWENYLLDFLLLAWLGWAFVIILLVNVFFHFHGPLKTAANDPWAETSGFIRPQHGEGETHDYRTNIYSASPSGLSEKCFWLNALIDWFYNRVDTCPILVDTWIFSLNEQARKLGGPVQIKLEKLEPGSPPPKISDIKYEISSKTEDSFVVSYFSDAHHLSFSMFASQKTHTGMKLTNCLCEVARYQAKIKLQFKYSQGHIILTTNVDGQPLAKVKVKPINPYQESEEVVDLGVVEEVVRNALCLSSMTINMTDYLGLSSIYDSSQDLNYKPVVTFPDLDEDIAREVAVVSHNITDQVELSHKISEIYRRRSSQAQQTAVPYRRASAMAAPPPKPPRAVGDKRLFVKIIKATSLGGREVGSGDPFCVLLMDSPYQKYETTVARNTVSPFWDEHFLMDVSPASTLLRFELYDKGRSPADEFLGDAVIYMEDVRKSPSSRQIIPLQTPAGGIEYQAGSLTVEFLLMESYEVEQYMDSTLGPKNQRGSQASASPRHHHHHQQQQLHSGRHHPRQLEAPRTMAAITAGVNTSTPAPRSQYGTLLPANHRYPGALPGFWEITPTGSIIVTDGDENIDSPSSASADKSQTGSSVSDKDKKRSFSLAKTLKKKFGRSKVRSQSADRAHSLKSEGGSVTYLSPTESSFKPMSKSTEDINGISMEVTPIKKSSSLGGSLKKLFRRGRKRTREPGETSRESSLSRSSMRYPASSREGSIDSARYPYAPS
ncbi:C2 domain-containing protein 2-like isoform X6 [Argonauta hians]